MPRWLQYRELYMQGLPQLHQPYVKTSLLRLSRLGLLGRGRGPLVAPISPLRCPLRLRRFPSILRGPSWQQCPHPGYVCLEDDAIAYWGCLRFWFHCAKHVGFRTDSVCKLMQLSWQNVLARPSTSQVCTILITKIGLLGLDWGCMVEVSTASGVYGFM